MFKDNERGVSPLLSPAWEMKKQLPLFRVQWGLVVTSPGVLQKKASLGAPVVEYSKRPEVLASRPGFPRHVSGTLGKPAGHEG